MAEDMRSKIAADFETLYDRAFKALEQALDADKSYSVKCANPRCGRTNQIQGFPDVTAITKALQAWHDMGLGKAAQQKEQPAAVTVKPGADLEAMSDDELAAIIAAG